MILLFGDSWARQSWQHVSENRNNGYKHWSLPDTWVVNTDDWLNSYFNKHLVINLARFGNTTDWIIRDLFHALNTVTNLPDRVDFVVFQTDPLRIFAPRQDYTDQSIVWPNFVSWCDRKGFAWSTSTLDDLFERIYHDWYQDLVSFQYQAQSLNPDKQCRLWLVGGVSALHPSVNDFEHQTIVNSISGFFGLDQDCCLENRASLTNFVKFWTDSVTDPDHRYKIKQQWQYYETILQLKEQFWIQNPGLFAGRHLTSQAMRELATHLEHSIEI